MLTADQIIKRLGGAKKIADEIGAPLTTVASWGPVNFIPRWWKSDLLAMAVKEKKDLSAADFPTIEQRQPRPKKEAQAA